METESEPLIIPSPFDRSCFVRRNILNEEECKELIGRLQNPRLIDSTKSVQHEEGMVRIVERTSLKVAPVYMYM